MSLFLITGVAGFIGSNVASLLLHQGHTVHGIDNFADYYDPRLKTWRLAQLTPQPHFSFDLCDIEHSATLERCAMRLRHVNAVIHLAARAGVRSSVAHPGAGPGGRPDMAIFRFVRAVVEGEPLTIFGDGEQSRDFSFVDDIARGVTLALKDTGFRVFNLAANRPVTVNAAIRTIERLSGKMAIIQRGPKNPSDASDTWADVTRAKEELGWVPTVSLETGLESTLHWYMSNRAWAANISVMGSNSSTAAVIEESTAVSQFLNLAQAANSAPGIPGTFLTRNLSNNHRRSECRPPPHLAQRY